MDRRTGVSLVIAALAALAPALASAQVVDLSCIGVQVTSMRAKLQDLSAGTASSYRQVVAEVEQLAKAAAEEVQPVEKRWSDAVEIEARRIRSANPGASDVTVGRIFAQRLRESAELDNKFAAVLVAQLKAHKAEEQIIVKSRQIPGRDNEQKVAELSRRYAEESGAGPYVERIQRSRTLQHLVGTLAAAEAAARSSHDIPAAPLARLGFDQEPGEGRLVAATTTASRLVAEADARRTGAHLIVGHLSHMLGGAEERAALMRNRQSETARVTSNQIAIALNELHMTGVAMQTLSSGVRLDRIQVPAPAQSSPAPGVHPWQDSLAQKVTETVETVYEVVYGTPGNGRATK